MLGESGGKRGGGNMERRRMDVGSYFECRPNGSRQFGEWMRKRGVFLGHVLKGFQKGVG